MKLLSYIMTVDSGLAPNPFGKYCTLALCTPNHKNALLNNGDWILGLSSKVNGNKLLYFMKLTEEPMQRNIYYLDWRFDSKKPFLSNNRKTLVGDNIYYLENGRYKWKGINGFQKSRPTVSNYLESLVKKKFLSKQKIGRSNFYINEPLFQLFKGETIAGQNVPPIKTINPDY